MLETTITTTAAIKLTLMMAGAACIMAFGLLVIVLYLLNEWRKDLDAMAEAMTASELIRYYQKRYKGIQDCTKGNNNE